jgi:hypothetical protein
MLSGVSAKRTANALAARRPQVTIDIAESRRRFSAMIDPDGRITQVTTV